MDVNGIRNAVSINNAYSNVTTTDATNADTTASNENVKTLEIKKPEKVETNAQNKDEYDKKELDKAITHLNKFLERDSTHAEYSKHKDLGTIMIKIVNDRTKETILEAPPQKILDMIASLLREDGLLDKKA